MDQSSGLYITDGILREYSGQCSDIVIPEKVTSISSSVFKNFDTLRSIMLPSGLETIESRCFEGCSGLKTVMFPDSLNTIGTYAFAGCGSLVFYRLPAGLAEIGQYAFKDCRSLTAVELPENVKEIGVGAFAGCSRLESIRIPGMDTAISTAFGTHPFAGCSNLKIYTPPGSKAEKFAQDNGISVVNISMPAAARPEGSKKEAEKKPVSSGVKDVKSGAASDKAVKANTEQFRPASSEKKTSFVFEMPDSAGRNDDKKFTDLLPKKDSAKKEAEKKEAARKAAENKEAARAEAEKREAARIEAEKKAAAKKEAAKKEAEKREAEKREAARIKAEKKAEKKAAKAAAKEEKKAASRPRFSRKIAVIVLAVVIAAGAGAAFAYYRSTHNVSGKDNGQSDYTLTLEDYVNNNEAAKQQLVESVEDTDVIISVSNNTLIYTYDLSTSNSMTPEIAESDELKESLGETLDSNDEQFTELCAGLEKDTGISGVSVIVVFEYGDEVLLTRTYSSAGKQE